MAKIDNLKDFFGDLAETLRFKYNSEEKIAPNNMADLISNIDPNSAGGFENEVTCINKSGINNVKTITVFQGVTVIKSKAYQNFTALQKVKLFDSIETISSYAFQDCKNLETINIPNTVKSIGESCFSGCTKLSADTVFPESLTFVGRSALSGTSWFNNATINPNNSVVYVGKCCYSYKGTLEGTITLKEGTVCISPYAFQNSTMTELICPGGLLSLEGWSVYNCANLTKIKLSSSSERGIRLGQYSINACPELKIIYINNLYSTSLFLQGSPKLEKIYIMNTTFPEKGNINKNHFGNIPSTTKFYVSPNLVEQWKTFLERTNIEPYDGDGSEI